MSNPEVDAYNVHVGTETFAGLYKFTTNTLLVETAQAITNLGSDSIKLYLGSNTAGQSGVTRPPNVTNLITLVRDEPNYRQVLNMPFRNFVMWAYPLSNPDAPFQDGNYTPTEQANDYREMYDLTCYLLTNYNNSGKTFYLGHWEGDGYLEVNGWTTNPSPAVVTNMIAWLNNRQKAVDDARAATVSTNVTVYNYSEVNRVRDAMLNGPANNVRSINSVIPYVTNLDWVSYSSYDAQNLNASDLYTTLNYIEAHIPTNKATVIPQPRLWIGEYGRGGDSTDAQEPFNRGYIQRLLNWNYGGRVLPFILYWEIYDNEPGKNFCLVNSNGVQVASWYLFNHYLNDAHLLTAQFKETNGRLPADTEFASLVSPMLSQPIPAPVSLTINNASAILRTSMQVTLSGTLAQGIYGDDEASVWVYYGREDGGTNFQSWEGGRYAGMNTNFNPATFAVTISGLAPQTNYYYRFFTANSNTNAWAPASSVFSTVTLNPSDYGSSLKITFSGYSRGETLSNFPMLVNLSTNLPGFSYSQFASPMGNDLRFTDASGVLLIPHEIDEWNTNGTSSVWVNVPSLSTSNDFIWAYWGNPSATNLPAYTTNGAVWPGYDIVWHLKEKSFPFEDSANQYPATSGILPTQTSGIIGHAQNFNGSTMFLDGGVISNLNNVFTLSAWVNIAPGANNEQTIWCNKQSGWNTAGFDFYVNGYQTNDGVIYFDTSDGVGGSVPPRTSAHAVTFGQWHLLTGTMDGVNGAVHVYVDGVDQTINTAVDTAFQVTNYVRLGALLTGTPGTTGSLAFNGSMDETRIHAGMESSNWIWASWMTVASNPTLQTYAAVARQSPSISIGSNASGPFLSWPGSGVGFSLYTTTNLNPPAVWLPATNQIALTNSQWQVSVPADGGTHFYRLKSQ